MTSAELVHRTSLSSGHRIHRVDCGQGPLVILVHGFPESWYSWRHQLSALADAGYQASAIDVRGYGRSAAPDPIEAYAMTSLVGDVIAVLDDVGVETAVVVGHDWGAPIAWNTALLRPDRVRAVAGLSVPYNPRGDTPPLDALRALAGEDLFYIDYFQEPGVAEAEVEADLEGWLRGFYFTASGESDPTKPSMGFVPRGHELRERLQQPGPGQMAWLSDEDLAFYVGEFERTGLTGGFNRYRNITRDWTELAPWRQAPIRVPALFIGGDRDGPTQLGQRAIGRFGETLPNLIGSHILDNCGHWVQQEQPAATNELLIGFLNSLG
ncbi:MAG: alpha/beta hydrolase [Actinomycetia bacterium]|nr:alpha/beta hydrolase [Actinomycetes bacterium]